MSLLEMLVAITLATVVMVGALALIIDLQRSAQASVKSGASVGSAVDVAIEHVVHDVRAAADLLHHVDAHEASSTTLVLLMPSGEKVVYTLEREHLVRYNRLADREELQPRLLVEHVTLLDFTVEARTVRVTLVGDGEPLRQASALLRNTRAERRTD